MMIYELIIISMVCVISLLIWIVLTQRKRIHQEFKARFGSWCQEELEKQTAILVQKEMNEWINEKESEIRKDAVKKSMNVTRGKVAEHLMPFFPDFPYNPKDVRFIGSPIDLLVFDGLNDGKLKSIDIPRVT